jgi:hypothetical protein
VLQDQLQERLADLFGPDIEAVVVLRRRQAAPVEAAARRVLGSAGVPMHLRGWTYLVHAVTRLATAGERVPCCTVYREVAEDCHTTPAAVERDIRSALRYAEAHARQRFLPFMGVEERPTNGYAMFRFAELVRDDLRGDRP